ncbi:MAG: oligosaccharide flippase family protein [Ignavibacteriales bacterium]
MLKKIKQLTKETAVYGISTIIGRFINFLLVPLYTNVFVNSEFGQFTLIYAYLSFLNVVFIYGMDAAFLKYTSLAEADKKKDSFSTAYLFVFISTLLLCLLMFLFRNDLQSATQIPLRYSSVINYVILILFFDTVTLIPFANLRLENKSAKFAGVKLGNIFLNLLLNIILILKLKMGIESIFISNLAASVFSFVLLFPDTLRKLNFRISREYLKPMLKFAIPYLPGSLAAMMVQVIDVPIVRAMTNESTLGTYRANYKLGILMMLFVSMFNYAWQPFFLNNAKEKEAKELFSKVFTLFMITGSFIWIILSLFIDNLASIQIYHGKSIIGKDYLSGIFIVPVILLAYLFYGMYVNFTAGIYIEEKTKIFPVVTGSGAIVNVVVNIFLIPYYGIMGAAIATLASYVVMAVGLFFYSQKYYKINYEFYKVFSILFLIISATVIYYYLYYSGLLNLISKFLILIVFVASFFLLKIIKKDEVIKTMKIITRRKI